LKRGIEMDQVLYLEDKFAEPFAKMKEGQKVRLTVDAIVAVTGGIPSFDHLKEEDFDSDGKTQAAPKRKPYIHFVIKNVRDQGGEVLAQQSQGDIDEQIARAKGEELEPLDRDEMEKQIRAVHMQPDEEETY
jgi:hypothetical protein